MTASFLGFPVIESDTLTTLDSTSVIEFDSLARFQYVPVATWRISTGARARLARQARHAFLAQHDGQVPKSRRTKRAGKRLL